MFILNQANAQRVLTDYLDPDSQGDFQAVIDHFLTQAALNLPSDFVLLDPEQDGCTLDMYGKSTSDTGMRPHDTGYYGVTVWQYDYRPTVLHCYFGGSEGNSAPGFYLIAAELKE